MFIQLRGAPLLLSPADWTVAEDWHRRGIPFAVVRRALKDVFQRRAERGVRRRVQSLRYCAPAVEAAWEAVRELTVSGQRRSVQPLSTEDRLQRLADRLPEELPDRQRWCERIALVRGSAERVEEQLAAVDQELMDHLLQAMSEPTRRQMEIEVEKALARHSVRISESERPRAARRLLRQRIRNELGLPVLSLFSVEPE
jgi:hypothetical protein